MMTDISAFGHKDDVSFARYLVQEIGVAAVPDPASIATRVTEPNQVPVRVLQAAGNPRRGGPAAGQTRALIAFKTPELSNNLHAGRRCENLL